MKGFDHKAQQLKTARVQTQGEDEVKQPEEGELGEEELKQVSGGIRAYVGSEALSGSNGRI